VLLELQKNKQQYLADLSAKYPIISSKRMDERTGWLEIFTDKIVIKLQCCDDLFVTNVGVYQRGIERGSPNSIWKSKQIGTLTETLQAVKYG